MAWQEAEFFKVVGQGQLAFQQMPVGQIGAA